jgi:hypothetical protein
MSVYVVKYEGDFYANDELYWKAVAGGQSAFIKMLSTKQVEGVRLMDQTLYPLTPREKEHCDRYEPVFQDFDYAFRRINLLSDSAVNDVRFNNDAVYPGARLIELRPEMLQLFEYRRVRFFKVKDYQNGNKYRMVSKMATVSVYGRLYAALNAVDVRVEAPFVVVIKE